VTKPMSALLSAQRPSWYRLLGTLALFGSGLVWTPGVLAADRPMAVWYYADWCMNCKLIAPKIAAIQPDYEARVDFIKLDVTDAAGKARSQQRARELGILSLYMDNTATGWLALVDRNGRQVGELRQQMTLEQMRGALDRLAPTQ